MISVFSYLLTFIGVIFWGFRAITVLYFQLDKPFFAHPVNVTYEIIVLFLTLPCLIGVIKRNIVFAAGYLGLYAAYFGQVLYDAIVAAGETGLNIVNSSDMLITTIGIIIPLLTFLDILFNKNRALGKGAHKEDGFYANEKFDRNFDERADRNQYKF